MALHGEWFDNHRVGRIWIRDYLVPIEVTLKSGGKKTVYLNKSEPYDSPYVKGYWEYSKDRYSDEWMVFRVSNVRKERRLAYRTTFVSLDTIIQMIVDKEITYNDCNKVDEYRRAYHFVKKEPLTCTKWSDMFDGKSILALVAYKPKMTFKEIMTVIESEHGSVDDKGIIHKAK